MKTISDYWLRRRAIRCGHHLRFFVVSELGVDLYSNSHRRLAECFAWRFPTARVEARIVP